MVGAAAVATLSIWIVAGCGADAPEETVEDTLEQIAGQDLTPAEVQRQLEVADTLCRTDIGILTRMWDDMGDRQLRFQDFVFGARCAERAVEYAAATGRAVSPDLSVSTPSTSSTTTTFDGATLPLPGNLSPAPSSTPARSTPASSTPASSTQGPSTSIDEP